MISSVLQEELRTFNLIFLNFHVLTPVAALQEETISCLFQRTQCLFNTAHSLNDILITGGIAHAETLRVAKGITADCSDMTFLQQIHGEVCAVTDNGPVRRFLAVET